MKNNSTRKGLAIVAASSLLVAGFAGLPAQAAGISDGSVSLTPTTGAEFTTVSGGSMQLSANAATGVLGTGKYLKFQVEDALGKTSVVTTGSSIYSETAIAGADVVTTDGDVAGPATDLDSIAIEFAAVTKFKAGDRVRITGMAVGTDGANNELLDASVTQSTALAQTV